MNGYLRLPVVDITILCKYAKRKYFVPKTRFLWQTEEYNIIIYNNNKQLEETKKTRRSNIIIIYCT